MNVRSIPMPLVVVIAWGCAGDPAPSRVVAAVDTVGGVERLTYPAASAGTLDWSLDTVAVLGDAFAEDAYQFDQVNAGGLAADGNDNLYLLDRQGKRVLKYGPGGQHLGTFGREGEGPGELNQPIGLALGPGDTIWVSDFSNNRLTGIPQDGGAPRSIPLPEEGGIPGQRLVADENGFITLFRPIFAFGRGSGGGWQMSRGDGTDEAEGPPRIPVQRLDPSLNPVNTLWTTVEPPMDMVQLEVGTSLMVAMMAREYHPDFLWAHRPGGGIVVSDSAAYALHIIDAGGTLLRSVRREPAPRATTEADRELARDRLREEEGGLSVSMGGGGSENSVQDEMLRQRLEKMSFADLIPRVLELAVDPDGRIWVGVVEEVAGEMGRIDLYNPEGELLGELRDFPFPDVFLGPDRIGVLTRDDLDVQQVLLMDVNRVGEAVAAR